MWFWDDIYDVNGNYLGGEWRVEVVHWNTNVNSNLDSEFGEDEYFSQMRLFESDLSEASTGLDKAASDYDRCAWL